MSVNSHGDSLAFIDFLRQILMLSGVVSSEGKDCKPFSLNVNNDQ